MALKVSLLGWFWAARHLTRVVIQRRLVLLDLYPLLHFRQRAVVLCDLDVAVSHGRKRCMPCEF